MNPSLLRRIRRPSRSTLEHEQLTSLINSMADGVLALDKHMHIVVTNGAALNILDVNNTPIKKSIDEVLTLEDETGKTIMASQLISSIKTPSVNRDLLLKYTDGSTINLYLSIAPLHLGFGKQGTRGYVVLFRDITHEKSLEEERSEFISVVSHELRTPVAIAEGNISNAQFVAERSTDISQIKEALAQAHDQIIFLASMVNDLSTLSRAERGLLTFEPEQIDITQLVDSLKTSYANQAAVKKLKLRICVPKHINNLTSSKLYVREILQNFIVNAIKYTDEGSVTICAEPSEKGVKFAISDTGIGISKGDQNKIFGKFFRSEDYRTRKTNGTGLGLYVSAKLAHLLRASIDVQSRINKGSTFLIDVPNIPMEGQKISQPPVGAEKHA